MVNIIPVPIPNPNPVIHPFINQPFPQISAPFTYVRDDTGKIIGHGFIEQIWLQLLINLWNRTGQAAGTNTADTEILAAADDNGGGGSGDVASNAELASLMQDAVQAEIMRLGLDQLLVPRVDPLEALLFEASPPASAEQECCASWIPIVDGSEPPNFITDGAGNLILVAYGP